MTDLETGELRVVVPVGFLLAEEQEVSVSVARPDGGQLPIRLHLVPARPTPVAVNEPTPATISWSARKLPQTDDGYPVPTEYGGSD